MCTDRRTQLGQKLQKKVNVENTILEIFAADGQNFVVGSSTRIGTIKVSKSVTGMELK